MGEVDPFSSDSMEDNGGLSSKASVASIWDTITYPNSAPNVSLIHNQVRYIKKCSRYVRMISWMDEAINSKWNNTNFYGS